MKSRRNRLKRIAQDAAGMVPIPLTNEIRGAVSRLLAAVAKKVWSKLNQVERREVTRNPRKLAAILATYLVDPKTKKAASEAWIADRVLTHLRPASSSTEFSRRSSRRPEKGSRRRLRVPVEAPAAQ